MATVGLASQRGRKVLNSDGDGTWWWGQMVTAALVVVFLIEATAVPPKSRLIRQIDTVFTYR